MENKEKLERQIKAFEFAAGVVKQFITIAVEVNNNY